MPDPEDKPSAEDEETERILGDGPTTALALVSQSNLLVGYGDSRPLVRVEVKPGVLGNLLSLPKVKAAMVPGTRYLSEHTWADGEKEMRLYEMGPDGLQYNIVTWKDLRPAPTEAELAVAAEHHRQRLVSTVKCPRCRYRIPREEAEAHAEQHCPVGGDLFFPDLCPFDRRQPVHRRTESQRLAWAQHRIAHPARVAAYQLLDDLRLRLTPRKLDEVITLAETGRDSEEFAVALRRIITAAKKQGRVIAAARKASTCARCSAPIERGDLIMMKATRPGDLVAKIPGSVWIHLMCSSLTTDRGPPRAGLGPRPPGGEGPVS